MLLSFLWVLWMRNSARVNALADLTLGALLPLSGLPASLLRGADFCSWQCGLNHTPVAIYSLIGPSLGANFINGPRSRCIFLFSQPRRWAGRFPSETGPQGGGWLRRARAHRGLRGPQALAALEFQTS